MPAPLVADWGQVKATAIATGNLREAATIHGIPHAAVRQRAKRESWPVAHRVRKMAAHAQAQAVEQVALTRVTPVTVTESSPGDALAAHLKATDGQTRAMLATSILHAAGQARTTKHPLDRARNIHEVAKAAALVHGWQSAGQEQRPMMGLSMIQINLHGSDAS